MYYILDEQKYPVKVDDYTEVAAWEESTPDACRVRLTKVKHLTVSTVFLTIDHNHTEGSCIPVVFETMVFEHFGEKGKMKSWREDIHGGRASYWEDAVKMHERTVEEVRWMLSCATAK